MWKRTLCDATNPEDNDFTRQLFVSARLLSLSNMQMVRQSIRF